MKRRNRLVSDPSLFHILMGEPDDSCEVCRAHGIVGHDLPEGPAGMSIVEMGPLEEILKCGCPLCSQLRYETFDGPPQPPPRPDEDDSQDLDPEPAPDA